MSSIALEVMYMKIPIMPSDKPSNSLIEASPMFRRPWLDCLDAGLEEHHQVHLVW